MKGLLKYIHDDFSDWLNDPLYHGGAWEDMLIGLLAAGLLGGFIIWQL